MNDAVNNKKILLMNTQKTPRLYKKRWLMLFIYFIIVPVSTLQWTQYTIIANIMVDYYNVSYEAINWTNLVALLLVVIFALPFSYVVDKYGIRNGALIAMCGTTLGAWIKVGSVPRDKFWVVMLGQVVTSLPQICLLVLGPKLSANWFGPNEVAIANSIGIVSVQLGMALGFVLPPILVKKETVERDLFITALGLAIICTLALLLVFMFFLDKPPIPPSQASLKKPDKVKYLKSFKNLLKNVPFLLVIVEAGCYVGIFCSVQTLLNQMILKNYPNGEEDAGQMGLLMMILCIVGCSGSGAVLSKFKTYRLCFWFSTFFLAASLFLFTYTLQISIIFPYIAMSLFGLFYGQFWTVIYEIVVEITYPEPEGIAIGLFYIVGQAIAIIFTYIHAYIFYNVNDTWANCFFAIIALISFIVTLFTRYDLKRKAANLKSNSDYISLEMRPKI